VTTIAFTIHSSRVEVGKNGCSLVKTDTVFGHVGIGFLSFYTPQVIMYRSPASSSGRKPRLAC